MIPARNAGATLTVGGFAGLIIASALSCAGLPDLMLPCALVLASGLAMSGAVWLWGVARRALLVSRVRAAMREER